MAGGDLASSTKANDQLAPWQVKQKMEQKMETPAMSWPQNAGTRSEASSSVFMGGHNSAGLTFEVKDQAGADELNKMYATHRTAEASPYLASKVEDTLSHSLGSSSEDRQLVVNNNVENTLRNIAASYRQLQSEMQQRDVLLQDMHEGMLDHRNHLREIRSNAQDMHEGMIDHRNHLREIRSNAQEMHEGMIDHRNHLREIKSNAKEMHEGMLNHKENIKMLHSHADIPKSQLLKVESDVSGLTKSQKRKMKKSVTSATSASGPKAVSSGISVVATKMPKDKRVFLTQEDLSKALQVKIDSK